MNTVKNISHAVGGFLASCERGSRLAVIFLASDGRNVFLLLNNGSNSYCVIFYFKGHAY